MSPPPHERSTSWIAPAGLLMVVLTVNLLCMPAVFQVGDPFAWREEAKAIWRGGLAVDAETVARLGGDFGQYFVLNQDDGQWYSKYGIMNSLMSVPPTAVEWWLKRRLPGPQERPDLLIFNLYQIVLSLATCALLYRLTGWYTPRVVTRIAYVLAVFYGTYFWFYQRAQGGEIYQVLFYTAFFACLIRYLTALRDQRGDLDGNARAAWLGLWIAAGALVFTRPLFGVLIVVVVVAAGVVIWRLGSTGRWEVWRREAGFLLAPAVIIAAALLYVNTVKFGAPGLTGYHQWRPEAHVPSWTYWKGLYGLLFDMQGSIVLYFPVLLLALPGLKRFSERYPLDTAVMWTVFGLFYVILGKTSSWLFGWTYGPRYMLFMLPVLGLPLVTFVDRLLDRPREWVSRVAIAAMLIALVYSAHLQERANRLEFFTYHRIESLVERIGNREVVRQLRERHLGAFCAELWRNREHPEALPWMRELRASSIPPEDVTRLDRIVRGLASRENYYWATARRA